jgi:hypothetical protein
MILLRRTSKRTASAKIRGYRTQKWEDPLLAPHPSLTVTVGSPSFRLFVSGFGMLTVMT